MRAMPSRILGGIPSDQSPEVLAAGSGDVGLLFVSLSAREPEGRDQDYIEWHSLDHRPEQYRIVGLRHSLRVVSTPACRTARAASAPSHDAVDHVMTYFWHDEAGLQSFGALSDALTGGRRPVALPGIEFGVFNVAGKVASPRAVVGADVIPWRPALGVYVLLEEGSASPEALVEVDGVAGIWWHEGIRTETPGPIDSRGRQLTYCYLDDDPVAVAERLRPPLEARWEGPDLNPLLAAPFHTLVPFEWGRHLP